MPDGRASRSAVFAVGSRYVGADEVEPVVDLRELFAHDHRSEEIRENLFGPDVVEPLHRHVVAEPHVRRFVRDQAASRHAVFGRRIVFEEHRTVGVECRPHVLHTAVLETGDDDQVVFGERIGYSGICFQPVERMEYLSEDFRALGRFLRIGFAVVQRYTAAVAVFGDPFEPPAHE